jgi:hypothetical protein
LLFLAEESRHFSIDLIVALFPGHSSEAMFHLWLLFYPEIQLRSGRGSLMDDKREGRPSFKTSDVVKNEVSEVIDGDRRLTVCEVVDKCVISKTTVHEILVQELHMNRICARWVIKLPLPS